MSLRDPIQHALVDLIWHVSMGSKWTGMWVLHGAHTGNPYFLYQQHGDFDVNNMYTKY